MSNAARAGRRRRFLHEGSSESSNRSASQPKPNEADSNEAATGNRYAHRADSASFAMAKRLLPQTWVSISSTVLGLFGVLAMLVAVGVYGPQLQESGSLFASGAFQFGTTATLGAWFASTLWLAIAGVSLVLFGVRRQRMDDLRCQYRWWLVAAFVSLTMSLNASIGGHQYLANGLAQLVGWSPLPLNAFWWFVPAGLITGALAIRMILDLAESRLALTTAILAMVTITLGWSVEAGLMPNSLANVSPLLASPLMGPATSLAGASLILLAMLFYSRNIVLEEGGIIAKPTVKPATKSKSKTAKPKVDKTKSSAVAEKSTNQSKPIATESAIDSSTKPTSSHQTRAERRAEEKRQRQARARSAASEPTLWVSGDDSNYKDEYEENGASRKLSKSERKRLRKQKARRAA